MQEGGALFPMQSMQPLPGRPRLFAMPSSGKPPRQIALYRLACPAVNLSRAACGQSVNRCQLATMRAGLFRMQSRRRRWRGLQPYNAARPSMARHNESMQREPTPDCPGHAAPGGQCMQCHTIYANSPRIALYKPCRFALYPPRATHCKSYLRPFQTV